jgi:hypothetical protein
MNEIECARCGWNWIMFEGQTERDCPFCPKEPGGFVFVTETETGVVGGEWGDLKCSLCTKNSLIPLINKVRA